MLPVLLLLLGAPAPSAQQAPPSPEQTPTFRSGVQVVEVDVRVFDKEGRFVADLTRDDFEIVEDGAAQQLQTLFLVGERGTATVSETSPPDTVAVPLSGAPETVAVPLARQTWIFAFDLNHLTPGAGFDRARQAVEEFIRDRFKDGDLAGVVAGSKMVNNRLTSVREELVGAVKSVKPLTESRGRQIEMTREWPRLLNEDEVAEIVNENRDVISRAVTRACTEDPDACTRVPPDMEIRSKARRLHEAMQRMTMETLTALNALASGLAKIPGPKTIVFLSDGFVSRQLETTLRNVVGQTARAGGRVYAIDVRGLNRGRGAGIIEQDRVVDEAGPVVQFDAQEDGPNSLAVDTGGMMIRNENNIGRALDRIASDSGRYYVLGYQPTNANFDGKFRPIEVRVKRPDVRVRARRGYLALEPSKMLIPQPITSSPISEEPPEDTEAPPLEPAADPPAVTATGAIVGAPGVTAADSVRLRPDAEERVETLATEGTAAAGLTAYRGWDAYQRGDVETALVAFTEAAAQPDVRPWVLYALGLSQVAVGRPLDAAASWERVRQAAPEFTPIYTDLADTYVQLSELSKALAVLRDAERRWPDDPDIHNGIGVIHVRRGALDDAVAAFSEAAKAAPDDALGYFNLARAYELRYMRSRRYVSSQRKWVAPEDDRVKAAKYYERYVKIGGPYAQQAAEALSRLEWSKK
jgi:VWFA-related protein